MMNNRDSQTVDSRDSACYVERGRGRPSRGHQRESQQLPDASVFASVPAPNPAEAETVLTTTAVRAPASPSSPPSVPPPQEQPRLRYDLLQYLNTTPLGGAVMNLNEDFTDPASRAIISNQNFIIRILIYLHMFMMLTVCALIAWSVTGFQLRIYEPQQRPSECLIFFWLLRLLVRTCMSAWSIRYQCRRLVEPKALKYVVVTYNSCTFVWLMASIYYLIFRPQENLHTFSCRTAFFLMWMTFACNISPILAYAVLSVLLYPLISFIIRVRAQGSLSPALPRRLLLRLEVERFDKVVARINRGETKHLQYTKDYKTRLSESLSSVTVSMFSDDGGNNGQGTSQPDATPTHQTSTEMSVFDRLCAICILEIADSEKVFVMPCDLRHFFHKDCLKKWFKKSRICPICRVNIGEVLMRDAKRKPVRSG